MQFNSYVLMSEKQECQVNACNERIQVATT
jgi:hypothetical protein